MIRLTSEIDRNDDILAYDYLPTIKQAILLAERGFDGVRLELPDRRRLTVRQIVKKWGLQRYLRETAL